MLRLYTGPFSNLAFIRLGDSAATSLSASTIDNVFTVEEDPEREMTVVVKLLFRSKLYQKIVRS